MNNEASHPDAAEADQRFFAALLGADTPALEELLAPEFLIVDINAGAVTPRAEFLALVTAGAVRFIGIETFPDETIVRRFDNTAIVVGRTDMTFALPDGAQVRAASRYTHVFVTDGERWRLVSAQGTQIT